MQCVEVPFKKQRMIDNMDNILEFLSNTNDPKLIESKRNKLKNIKTAIREYDRRH